MINENILTNNFREKLNEVLCVLEKKEGKQEHKKNIEKLGKIKI